MVLFVQIVLVAIAVFCLGWAACKLRREMWMRVVLFAIMLLGFLACGPISKPPPRPSFVVVVHNLDIVYPETAVVSWWKDSEIIGITTRTIPAGGDATFFIGFIPDGFELDTTAHPAQSGGQAWSGPEISGCYVFHVVYPTGYTWKEYEVK